MAPRGPTAWLRSKGRRLRRRSTATQVRNTVVALAVVGGLLYAAVADGTPSTASGKRVSSASTVPAGAPSGVGIDQASTSSRGVVGDTINIAFPVSNLTSLASNFGFAGDAEDSAQTTAIHIFVNAINKAGGIDGRRINPIIATFDPTNEAGMRALCKQWTEGNPPVFAVLDGLGSWTGDNELCIAQEGQTPFIGEWTTVTNWTAEASPYLWWLGPDQADILATLVDWGVSSGLLGGGRKVAIVAGDRQSDQIALNDYLLPDMARAGLPTPMVQTIPTDTSDTAAVNSSAPLIVQRLKAAGVQSVIPLMPFNSFFVYLAEETDQSYFPKLLLSDYESSVQVALGLIPTPFEQALNDQEGVTVETLGGTDAPASVVPSGGYDAGVQDCFDIWHAAHPKPLPGQTLTPGEKPSPYIEEQGPIAGWCQAIELFAAAAEKAGRDLNRRTFVEAMAQIQNFPGTWSPVLSYGPDTFAGPTEYQVVELHNNVPPSSQCVMTWQHMAQGTCWVVIQGWQPLDTG